MINNKIVLSRLMWNWLYTTYDMPLPPFSKSFLYISSTFYTYLLFLSTHATNTWEYVCIIWETQPCKIQETHLQKQKMSYVYWTVHHLGSWIKTDQLDVTCFIISLFNAQHVSDVSTSILRSLRLICWVISLFLMQAEALVPQPA